MNVQAQIGFASAAVLLLLGACSSSAPEQGPVRTVSAVTAPTAVSIPGGVIGQNAVGLVSRFGAADLDVREGSARKLQFAGPACVLDAYLYPASGGSEPVVTHVDARLPDGRDMDHASCVAALSRR